MAKLNLLDLKQAIWDSRFRDLFPEMKDQFERYLKDPGCACNVGFLKGLMREGERLKQYFPTKEMVTTEEEVDGAANDYVVINCPVEQLQDRLRTYPKTKRMVAAARWQNRVTVVLNDVSAIIYAPEKGIDQHMQEAQESPLNWKVINTTKDDLVHELRKLPPGRKTFALTRWQDKVTLVVNDLTSLF